MGPMHWIHGWGLAYGIYPWDTALVMEDLMGRHFWWRFRCIMRQTIANGGPVPRCTGQTRALFQASTTRRPSPHTEDSEGIVPPRSVTDSTEQWV
jgi:hypothetical protein